MQYESINQMNMPISDFADKVREELENSDSQERASFHLSSDFFDKGCPVCGKRFKRSSHFCPYCGKYQYSPIQRAIDTERYMHALEDIPYLGIDDDGTLLAQETMDMYQTRLRALAQVKNITHTTPPYICEKCGTEHKKIFRKCRKCHAPSDYPDLRDYNIRVFYEGETEYREKYLRNVTSDELGRWLAQNGGFIRVKGIQGDLYYMTRGDTAYPVFNWCKVRYQPNYDWRDIVILDDDGTYGLWDFLHIVKSSREHAKYYDLTHRIAEFSKTAYLPGCQGDAATVKVRISERMYESACPHVIVNKRVYRSNLIYAEF